MKIFKFAAFIIAAILSCGFITSCGDDEPTTPGGSQQGSEASILGTWSGVMTYEDEGGVCQQHMKLTFNSDNTCVVKVREDGYSDTMYGTYAVYGNLVSGATLEFTFTDFGEAYTEFWSIRINGNTAVMTDEDGVSVTLTRR